ncbi:LytR C-terminal domain-containing protein [Citricoccus nitrophenolicus]|uniref:LytR cell envelope-related transcriptional attenuator n=1 Tax=Citricoccus muralis TaxID=169134 RepID=A0A3D9LG69_9MICC|nr:LytR C-terminal domain-containing protein [Citricoccus muralis]REE05152.1 LytR cell envelope-related transcriptional attenuator [Citricoccus muralis]
MTLYPHDQFDDVPAYKDRKGTHRADPTLTTGSSGLVGISVAAALALAVGAFSFLVLPSLLPSDPANAGAAASASASASATVEAPAESAGPEASPTGEMTSSPEDLESPEASEPAETAASGEASAAESEPVESEPAESEAAMDTGDTSAPVEVYNSSSIGGLAGRVSGVLSSGGFTVAGSGNWQGFSVSGSAVYYSQNETTAQAVAAELGLPLVYEARVPGVAVVLSSDYAG